MAKTLAKIVDLLTPKRRWAQFSLLTLFLVVTVLCVGLRLVVVPAERQRRAVAAVEALGGRVAYGDREASEAFPKLFLRRWLPRDYFDDVRAVSLNGTQNTDSGLVHLQGLTELKSLDFANTQVTDAGLTQLQRLTGLQKLYLGRTQVTDAGLALLDGLMRLEWLSVSGTRVTDAGLAHLHGLMRLKAIWLNRTQVTDAGLAQLRQALPNCLMFEPDPRP